MVLHDAHVIRRIEHLEHEQAWKILNRIEKCRAKIDCWEKHERDAKTSTDAILAEERLKTLYGSLAQLNEEFSGDFQAAPATGTELSAPVMAAGTAEQRQASRWQMCVDRGLKMPKDTFSTYPRGIGEVAKTLGIKRQSLREDLNKHRERTMGK